MSNHTTTSGKGTRESRGSAQRARVSKHLSSSKKQKVSQSSNAAYLASLSPKARGMVGASDEDRIKFILKGQFIEHKQAKEALDVLEYLYEYPGHNDMNGLLLCGETRSGKTRILEHFRDNHPPEWGEEASKIPVVMIEAPTKADVRELYAAIFGFLKVLFNKNSLVEQTEEEIKRLFNKIGVKVLIVDEIHNVLTATPIKQRQIMIALKGITNRMKIPVVVAGTEEASNAISSDGQIDLRYKPIELSRWKMNEDYGELLTSLQSILPLRRPSFLTTNKVAQRIIDLTGGYLGEIISLVKAAAIYAIKHRTERVTLNAITKSHYVQPSRTSLAGR